MSAKPDIRSRDDILQIVKAFYNRLLTDPVMSPIFLEVAKIDLEEHLPVLVDFWDSILFFTATYKGNAMEPHLRLHEENPLKKEHFRRWLAFFNLSVDEGFAGKKATLMKDRAKSIALLMEVKVNNMKTHL
ncbi:MAG: group III truncated hemoglobin [Bacteroidota bacterium]